MEAFNYSSFETGQVVWVISIYNWRHVHQFGLSKATVLKATAKQVKIQEFPYEGDSGYVRTIQSSSFTPVFVDYIEGLTYLRDHRREKMSEASKAMVEASEALQAIETALLQEREGWNA